MAAELVVVTQNAQLFSELNTMITVTAAFCIAADLHVSGHINYQAGDYVTFEGHLLKKNVRLPLVGPVGAALVSRLPDEIGITVEDPSAPAKPFKHEARGIGDLLTSVFQPMLVNYFEKQRPALEARYGADRTCWPAAWQMGWLVRNGLSHGNKVFFERPSQKPVTWGGIALSHADNNKRLVFGILNQADLLLLLFDMEDSLFTPLVRRAV